MKNIIFSLGLLVFLMGAVVPKTNAVVGGIILVNTANPTYATIGFSVFGLGPNLVQWYFKKEIKLALLVITLDEEGKLTVKDGIKSMLIDKANFMVNYPDILSDVTDRLLGKVKQELGKRNGERRFRFEIDFTEKEINGFTDGMELSKKQDTTFRNILGKIPVGGGG